MLIVSCIEDLRFYIFIILFILSIITIFENQPMRYSFSTLLLFFTLDLLSLSLSQATTPTTITLIQYLVFETTPYQISFNGASLTTGVKSESNTIITEYCDGGTSNSFLSGKRLDSIDQLRGQNCGQGNLLLRDVNSRIQVLHKHNNSIIFSPSDIIIGSQFINDSSKIFYIYENQTMTIYNTASSTSSTISNCTSEEVTKIIQSPHSELLYLQTVLATGDDKFIEIYDSDFVALGEVNISDECLLDCTDFYYISENQSLTHAHNQTIDVYHSTGQSLFSIFRENQIYSAFYLEGSVVYSIENNTNTVMLRITGIYTHQVLAECQLSETGRFYRIQYNSEIQQILLYNMEDKRIYSISEVTEEPIMNQESSFAENFSKVLLSDLSISAISKTQIGVSLSLSSQLLTGVSGPIFNLIEDFWFYKYHLSEYPEFVENLTQQFDLINYLRVQTFFADVDLPQITIGENQSVAYSQVTCFQGERAPLDQYFISATKQVYIFNSCMTFLLFLAQFIFRGLIYGFYKINPRFLKLHKLVSSRIKIRNFFTGFFLPNIGIIIFFSSIQLRNMYSFKFQDKINLLIMIVFHSTWIFFVSLSYILIYQYESKESSQDIIQVSKFSLKGFFIETLIFHSRRFFFATIHGMLLNYQIIQLLLLCLTDIGVITVCLKYRKKFISSPLCISITLYFATFCAFNATLFIYKMNFFPENDFNNITTILVIILLILTGIKTFVVIIHELINLIKWIREECCPTNRVEDENQKKEEEKAIENEQKQKPKQRSKSKRKKTPSNPLPKNPVNKLKKNTVERKKRMKEEKVIVENYEGSDSEEMEGKIYVNVYQWEKKIKMEFTTVKHTHNNLNSK